MRQRILVVDDDPDLVTYLRSHLEQVGFGVTDVPDAASAFREVAGDLPDLILLDVAMPDGGGFALLQRLLMDRRTTTVPLIVLTAEGRLEDRVRALRLGADDYVVKPFEPAELAARIRTVLRRARQLRDLSPLTGLPGNVGITRELEARLASGEPLAVVHADIRHFKAFNDVYGFLRGDGVIAFCASCLRQAADEIADKNTFVGHVGGDDFVVITAAAAVEALCRRTIELWDGGIAGFYDPADAERGWVAIEDRQGQLQRYPPATLSLGVATTEHRSLSSAWEASAIAAEMKEHAKRVEGSSYQMDRRHE